MSALQIGTPVRIKDWDDLVDAYGMSEDGYIRTPEYLFHEKRRECCGKNATIINFYDDQGYKLDIDGGVRIWTPEMFDVIDIISPKVPDLRKMLSESDQFLIDIHFDAAYRIAHRRGMETMFINIFGVEEYNKQMRP